MNYVVGHSRTRDKMKKAQFGGGRECFISLSTVLPHFHLCILLKRKKSFCLFFPARTHLENNKTRLSKVDTLIKRQRARNLQSILLRKKTLMNRITRNTFKTGSLASEVDSGGVVTIWDMYHTE